MKIFAKSLAAGLCAVLIVCLTACSADNESLGGGSDSYSSITGNSSGNSGGSLDSSKGNGSSGSGGSSGGAGESSGEPILMTAPDGEVFDASPYIKGDISEGFDCEGFLYAYEPDYAFNVVDDPELFELDEWGNYRYIGEELPKNTDFYRVNVGDKFGGLTVKAARCRWDKFKDEGPEDIRYYESYLELEGEVELTGFVNVSDDRFGGMYGDVEFFPDLESSRKYPCTNIENMVDIDFRYIGCCHAMHERYGWYGEPYYLSLGNIEDFESELKPGDEYLKVKVTLDGLLFDRYILSEQKVLKVEII